MTINVVKRIYSKFGIFAILILELIVFAAMSENFFRLDNLLQTGRQVSFIGIAAVGATMLMITGGIDIASGSMLAFSGVFTTLLSVQMGWNESLSIIAALFLGGVVGFITGWICTRFNVPSLIATLAVQTILKGAAFLITKAKPIYGVSEQFKFLGQGYIMGILPFPLLLMIISFIFAWWVLEKTYLGRYIYAVGGNAEAARLSGINTKMIICGAFISSSFFAAVSGVLMASRLNSGQPSIGTAFPMDVITAVVLGGVSLSGGAGKIINVVGGVLIMGILGNGMVILGLSEYWQWVLKGLVLLFAVMLNNIINTESIHSIKSKEE